MNKKIYKVERPIFSFEELNQIYNEERLNFNLLRTITSNVKKSKPSFKSIMLRILPFPIIMASFYKYKFIFLDIIAGITMVIFHIPQGMAYGLLAGLKPINGLYTSFFPPLIYLLFGTSRHLSIGTFSIMSLLSSVPVLRESKLSIETIINQTKEISNGTIPIDSDDSKLQISIATTLLAGIIQVAMGLFQFGCIMNYINDAMIGGFTTAVSFHVILSQLSQIFGFSIKRYSGIGELPYKLYLFAANIQKINWVTVTIAGICISILVLFSEVINPRFRQKFKFPLPIQLVLVIIGTIISYYVKLADRFKVRIVGEIPKGLPTPMIPDVYIWPRILTDAILLAIVGFVMNCALVKLYCLKFSYDANYNQEFVAYGLSNVFGSFFQCIMSAAALARSSIVVEVGMKSQVASLISCVFMVLVLLFIGPLFEHVPISVLSSIIIVSLKSMIFQLQTVPKLFRLSKYDFDIWIVSFIGTLLLNVPFGLVVGFAFSLLTIIIRLQNPKCQLLGQLPDTNIYKNIKLYKDANELPGVKIFRFDAPLYFGNAEYFQNTLYRKSGINPRNKKRVHKPIIDDDSTLNTNNAQLLRSEDISLETSGNKVYFTDSINTQSFPAKFDIQFIIIDCSCVNYVDNVAIRILQETYTSYERINIKMYLASPNYHIRRMLEKAKFGGTNLKQIMFVTVHDAVLRTFSSKCPTDEI